MGVQVIGLTHNKSPHEKEFIDFEFDGKHISEFGLVAVSDGGRLPFESAPDFEDEVSFVNGVDGQYYWGTRIKTLTKSFNLATDGMTEEQLNNFKAHFAPGKYGKFIEDRMSCRYGWARISSAIEFRFVPFKKIVEFCNTKIETNEYKGEGTIHFIFDNPYMYSTVDIINKLDADMTYEDYKCMYLNKVPNRDSWHNAVINTYLALGNNMVMNVNLLNNYWRPNTINEQQSAWCYYNPSMVDTDAILEIDIPYAFNRKNPITGPVYFSEIADDINYQAYDKKEENLSLPMNVIEIYKNENEECLSKFYYTSPNVIYQINKSIQIIYNFYLTKNYNFSDLEQKLRQEITNYDVMAWAASVLRIMQNKEVFFDELTGTFKNNGTIEVNMSNITGYQGICALNWVQYFNIFMLCILAYGADQSNFLLENNHYTFSSCNWGHYTIKFDGVNFKTTMTFNYNKIESNYLTRVYQSEINCGDMVCSPYLKLNGGDYLNPKGGYASYHYLIFKKGDMIFNPSSSKIDYKYTYI